VLTLAQVVAIAHRRGVPVIVDAASMLPPRENLTKFLRLGADLVSFSGGKGIRGPQSTGILAGRRDSRARGLAQREPQPGPGPRREDVEGRDLRSGHGARAVHRRGRGREMKRYIDVCT